MKTRKRTRITIETTRVLIVSTGGGRLNWCGECAAEVGLLTLDEAAAAARSGAGEILRAVEGREIHSVNADGTLLICPNSLLK